MISGTSKHNIEDELKAGGKTLPNLFTEKENNLWKYIAGSALIIHPAVFFGIKLLLFILLLLGIQLPMLNKPSLKTPDIEFVITQKEEQPIDPNTRFRSDKNSRAGGIHDPNRKVSMPSPAPQPAQKPINNQKPQQPQPVKPKTVTPVKKVVQQPPKGVQKAPVAPAKPSKPSAPVQRPVLKPSDSAPRPQVPKLAKAPTSPFKVEVPKTGAPVGSGFSTSSGTAATGGNNSASSGSKTGVSTSMPAPQFSTTRTTTTSAGRGPNSAVGGKGQGGYGTGNMGNPGPGNPSGAPGIDAIKSPQWGPYMRELESKIKRNWHPPKGDQSKRVVLLFKIGRGGELISVKVSKPSGSPANDQAAIQAVQMSAPFRALPPEFTGSSVEIDFTFDYNVLGASYR